MVVDLAVASKRRIVYKEEGTYGTLAGSSNGQVLRRTNFTVNGSRESFASGEKREDFQVADKRHGLKRVSGNLEGELVPGAWTAMLGYAVRRDFTGITTVNASSGDGFTTSSSVLTRAAGGGQSFITDGLFVGLVVRLGAFNAAIDGRNLLITAMTPVTLTLLSLDGTAIPDVGVADTNATISVPGKVSYIPLTNHTSKGFTLEDYKADIDVSRQYNGCRAGGFRIDVQPNRMATIAVPVTGLGWTRTSGASAPYFTSPTGAGTTRSLSADGYVRLNGGQLLCATSMQLNLDNGLEAPAVINSNVSPNVLYGRAAQLTGQFATYMSDDAIGQAFDDETELELFQFLSLPGSSVSKDFVNFYVPRVSIDSDDEDDPDTGITKTHQFQGLLKPSTTGYQSTTVVVQDSLAP